MRGRPNPYCAGFKAQEADPTENAQSVGSVVTFGRFGVAHLGDLTWNKEFDLMCPANRIGVVGSVRRVAPWPAGLECRGARPRDSAASGAVEQWHPEGRSAERDADHPLGATSRRTSGSCTSRSSAARSTPCRGCSLRTAWTSSPPRCRSRRYRRHPARRRPPPPAHNGPAYWIKVFAREDGTFTVTNQRNGFSKTYAVEGRPGSASARP